MLSLFVIGDNFLFFLLVQRRPMTPKTGGFGVRKQDLRLW